MGKRSRCSLAFVASDKKRRVMGNKSGQVTIFIVIAIVIVAAVVGYFFLSQSREGVGTETFDEKNPQGFIQACLEENFASSVEKISMQGGSAGPDNYVLYEGNSVEYLCYTNEDYKTCSVQQPLLKRHIESEIENDLRDEVSECFTALEENYVNRGYEVAFTDGETSIELIPGRISMNMDRVLSISKGSTERFEGFSIILNNNLYELVGISNSIVEWESTYGDAETTHYTNTYKDFRVEKKPAQNESKIYILTDINTGDDFQFASRSVTSTSGYG